MKIRLIGSKGKERKIINEVVKDLPCAVDIEEISDEHLSKYKIKHTPAIIIENIVIDECSNLSKNEFKEVILQFMEI